MLIGAPLLLPPIGEATGGEPLLEPGPLLVGDRAVFAADGDEDAAFEVLRLVTGRDAAHAPVEAVAVRFSYLSLEDEPWTLTYFMDRASGRILWTEFIHPEPSSFVGWLDRSYAWTGFLHLFGASGLAGGSHRVGDVYTYDLPNRDASVQLTIGAPNEDGWWPVDVAYSVEWFGIVGFPVERFWMVNGHPYPVRVEHAEGFADDTLVSLSRGSEVAWPVSVGNGSVSGGAASYDYLEVDHHEDPPHADPGGEYGMVLSFGEAVDFARANAPGLAAYEDMHGPAPFLRATAVAGARSSMPWFVEDAGIVLDARYVWHLEFKAPGVTRVWRVQVALEQDEVFGDTYDTRTRIAWEGERTSSLASNAKVSGKHVDFASFAASAADAVPGYEPYLWRLTRQPYADPRAPEPGYFAYELLYWPSDEGCLDRCPGPSTSVAVRSDNGEFIRLFGPPEFVAQIDATGLAPAPGS